MVDNGNNSGNGKDKKQDDMEDFYDAGSSRTNNHSHILIIDDEEIVRNSLSTILQREGFQVNAAGDVETAIEILNRESIDLVLADCQLDDRDDGLQLTQRIKNQFPKIIVVIISGNSSVDMAIQAMRSGAYDFFKKPYNPSELINSIHMYLGKRRKAMEHELEIRRQLKSLYKTFLMPEKIITEETEKKPVTALMPDIAEPYPINDVIPFPTVPKKSKKGWVWVGAAGAFIALIWGIYMLNKPGSTPPPVVVTRPEIMQTPSPIFQEEIMPVVPTVTPTVVRITNLQAIKSVLNTIPRAIKSQDQTLYKTIFSTEMPDITDRINSMGDLWNNYQIQNLQYVISTEYPPEISGNQAVLLVDWNIDLYRPSDQTSFQRKETNLIHMEKENNRWKITDVSIR